MKPEIWNLDQALARLAWGAEAEKTRTVVIDGKPEPVQSLVERMARGGFGGTLDHPPPSAWDKRAAGAPLHLYQEKSLEALRDGRITARGRFKNGELEHIAKSKWADLVFKTPWRKEAFAAPKDGSTTACWYKLELSADAVRKLATQLEAEPAVEIMPALTAEETFRSWVDERIKAHASKGTNPTSDEAWRYMQQHGFPAMKRPDARDLWKLHAPNAWRNKGPRHRPW